MQKSIVVRGSFGQDGWGDTTGELNQLLSDGWKVTNVAPMGAYGYGYSTFNHSGRNENGFASLVILEKSIVA